MDVDRKMSIWNDDETRLLGENFDVESKSGIMISKKDEKPITFIERELVWNITEADPVAACLLELCDC